MMSIAALYEALGPILQDAREKKGATQLALAEHLGYQQSFISKVEYGRRQLTISQLFTICEYLGADPVDIMRKLVHALTQPTTTPKRAPKTGSGKKPRARKRS